MASNSNRKSGSSGRSTSRRRVVIGAEETVRVRYNKDKPQVEAERRSTSSRRKTRQGPKAAPRAGTGASRQGKRISAAKRDERQRRQQTIRLKRIGLVVAIVTGVGAAVWGVFALLDAPIFRITEIQVSGISQLDEQEVLAAAQVVEGTTLPRLPANQVIRRLEAQPWVASVELDRDFPSTLRIIIKERVPAVTVDAGGTALWLVGSDGVWLGERAAESTDTVVVRDLENVQPVAGQRSQSEELLNAIRIARGVSQELRDMTRAISAPSIEKTAILTTDDVEIFIGDADRIVDKDRVAREILRRERGKVVYINVRVVDRPTWRGLD